MRKLVLLAALSLWLCPSPSLGVAREDFLVVDAQDVVDICTTPESDSLYTAAVAFCHGYLVGAYQYHVAMFGGGKAHPVVCFPEPTPTRTQAIDQFIAWMKANPEYGKEKPAEALTKFLVETWPCRKAAAK
jgi:hypothetical protein